MTLARDSHLSGLKVVDFSAVYAGPICTRLMADCGADVIKIEPPMGGDVIRGPKGMSRVFSHFNAGKRSVGINLNTPEGAALARDLVKDADVVVENYRPGIMKRFGLDYDSLKDEFPGLVYCSISGFGQSGPFVNRAAYAPIAHAASSFDRVFQSAQKDKETPPVANIMIADMLTGAYAHGATLTALLGRANSGRGDYIDVTMMESMMMLIPGQIQIAQIDRPMEQGGFYPIATNDGFVMVCIVSGKNLRCLADAIEKPDLMEDPRFQAGERPKNIEAFIATIENWTTNLSSRDCETRFNEAGVPCSIYNDPKDLFSHPQLTARGTFHPHEDEHGEFLIASAPFRFSSSDTPPDRPAPQLGEHTSSVLSSIRSGDQLHSMVGAGTISA